MVKKRTFQSVEHAKRWIAAAHAMGAAQYTPGHTRVYVPDEETGEIREYKIKHGPEMTETQRREARRQLAKWKRKGKPVPKTKKELEAAGPLVWMALFKEKRLPRKLATKDAARKLRKGKRLTKQDIKTLKTARTRGWLAKSNVAKLERVLRKKEKKGKKRKQLVGDI